jgi:hypothetical protein
MAGRGSEWDFEGRGGEGTTLWYTRWR